MNACVSQGVCIHLDRKGVWENHVEYRIPEASGGFVNVGLVCLNARKAVDTGRNIDIDIDVCFAFRRAYRKPLGGCLGSLL